MIVQATVDRVENGNTYFLLNEVNAEISICDKEEDADKTKEKFLVGDEVKLIILDDGKVTVLK